MAGPINPKTGDPMSAEEVIEVERELVQNHRDGFHPPSQYPVEAFQSPEAATLPLPQKGTYGSAGYDLMASKPGVIAPGKWAKVPTGLYLSIPMSWEAQIRPRSGLALKHGVTVLNSPGTIDSDYRGEIGVLLINHGDKPFHYKRGDRIAQMVFGVTRRIVFVPVRALENLPETTRSDGGFGSTDRGKHISEKP